jgi:hypothetical protein
MIQFRAGVDCQNGSLVIVNRAVHFWRPVPHRLHVYRGRTAIKLELRAIAGVEVHLQALVT